MLHETAHDTILIGAQVRLKNQIKSFLIQKKLRRGLGTHSRLVAENIKPTHREIGHQTLLEGWVLHVNM